MIPVSGKKGSLNAIKKAICIMDPTFSETLEKILEKQTRDYITFTQLKTALPAKATSTIPRNGKIITQKDLELYITPILPPEHSVYTRGNVKYLLRRSIPEIIISYIRVNPHLSLNQIKSRLPFKRNEMAEILNNLIEKGEVKLFLLPKKDNFGIRIILQKSSHYTKEDFKSGFLDISKGKPYVRIYELRQHLMWPLSEFNTCIQSLWDKGIVELQASDPSLLTEDQQKDSYRDKTGTLRILLFWREE